MSSALYRDIIMQWYRDDSHTTPPDDYSHSREAKNPLCGDDITLYATLGEDGVQRLAYEGKGCSISLAAAAMVCGTVEGKSREEARALIDAYLQMLDTRNEQTAEFPEYPHLEAMQAVKKYPGRLACARLAWETLRALLEEAREGDAQSRSEEE